jgi:serine/threonine-protein kinase
MAHGWAGLLYAALRWCTATGTPVPAQIRERLDQLGALSEYTGRGAQWPWELTPSDSGYMPGWCNGSAGYVFLWTLAARTFDDPSYQVLADKAAWNCWEDPDQAANLCCGLAGRSYALLHHYRQTRVSAWLERARSLAGPAAISIRDLPTDENADYANSLYKGDVGVAVLLADLATPDAAVMPFFESEFD